MDTEETLQPTSKGSLTATHPARHVVWAAIWTFLALFSVLAFTLQANLILGGELAGQRTEGFFLITPVLLIGAAVVCVLLAIGAVGPWRRLRAAMTPEQRRYHRDVAQAKYPTGLLLAVGGTTTVVAAAGFTYFAIGFSTISSNTAGLAAYVLVLGLFSAAAVAALDAGLRSAVSRRRLRAHSVTHGGYPPRGIPPTAPGTRH